MDHNIPTVQAHNTPACLLAIDTRNTNLLEHLHLITPAKAAITYYRVCFEEEEEAN
jgi:hypothetical protein